MKIIGLLNNQLIILESENKEQILKCYEGLYPFSSKFVLVYKDHEYYVIFFTDNHKHSDIAIKLNAENFSFIGAGSFRNFRSSPFFGSITCKNVFGYDKPKEQEKQKLLLEDIKKISEYIFNWVLPMKL